jgi:hypothetical protein
VINARLEDRNSGKGVSLAVPVNRLEWFLSWPEIDLDVQTAPRAPWSKPFEFTARLKTLFSPRDPIELELVLHDSPAEARRFPMHYANGSYRATATPFPGAAANPALVLTLRRDTGPSMVQVRERWMELVAPNQWGLTPTTVRGFFLRDVRRIRVRPYVELEGFLGGPDVFVAKKPRIKWPTPGRNGVPSELADRLVPHLDETGLDELLVELDRRLPGVDPEQVSEIQVTSDGADCTLLVERLGTTMAEVGCPDQDLKVQGTRIPLSDVRRLTLGKFQQLETATKQTLRGPITGLDGLFSEIRRQAPRVRPDEVSQILVGPPASPGADLDSSQCTVLARRSGTIVARLKAKISSEGLARPRLDMLSQGRFIRPKRKRVPATSLWLRVPGGDELGRCTRKELTDEFRRRLIAHTDGPSSGTETYLFDADRLAIQCRNTIVQGVDIGEVMFGHTFSPWRVEFRFRGPISGECPIAADPLLGGYQFKAYASAWVCDQSLPVSTSDPPMDSKVQPPDDHSRIRYFGWVGVWEIGIRQGVVEQLAMDFVFAQREQVDRSVRVLGAPLVGMLRFNSTFE